MSGSTGWIIRGNGTAEFANTSIRGTVTAGQVTTTGLTIYSNGAVTTTSGKFGVTAGGILSATEVNLSGAITATSGTFTGTVNASGGTMTGYLRAGDVYIGRNVYDASEHNGIGLDGSWNNAWVRRDSNDTTYFRAGSASTYIQMDTGGTSAISFPKFSVDSNGNASFQGRLEAGDIYIPNVTSPAFSVNNNGQLYASGAIIDGTISAGFGSNIGDFYFGQYGLTNGGSPNIQGQMTLDTYNNIIYTPWLRVSNGSNTVDARIGWIRIERYGAGGVAPIKIERERISGDQNYCAFSLVGYQGGVIGTISQNGSSNVQYNTSSDSRLKVEVKKEYNALEAISKIKPKTYKMKLETEEEKDKEYFGFFAQELYEVYPQAVKIGTDPHEEDVEIVKLDPWGIDYGRITPVLVKAIQELSEKVATLESKVL